MSSGICFLKALFRGIGYYVLYCIVGLVAFAVSYIVLAFNLDDVINYLSRSWSNIHGVFTSYFVHGNWPHLIANFVMYLIVVLIAFLTARFMHTKSRLPAFPPSWRLWLYAQLILMLIIGAVDLAFNPIYRFNGRSMGMSDLISALVMIAVGNIILYYYLEVKRRRNLLSRLLLCIAASIITLFFVVIFSFSSAISLVVEKVNVMGHVYGAMIGSILMLIIMTYYTHKLKSYTPLLTYSAACIASLLIICFI